MTDFSKIIFNPTYHSYSYEGQRLKPVTTLVNRLSSFDRDGKAAEIAKRDGLEVTEVLADWEAKGKAGRERGTAVHEYIAGVLGGTSPPPNDPFLALNRYLPEMQAFDQFWQAMAAMVQLHRFEWVIGDQPLGLGGTVDALLLKEGTYHIFDWKSGKFNIRNDFGGRCKPPFSDLDDCEFTKYSLQVSLYRLFLERNAEANGLEYPIGDSYLVHLSPSGVYQVHKVLDLRERALIWLNT